jgi:hypothetical protein
MSDRPFKVEQWSDREPCLASSEWHPGRCIGEDGSQLQWGHSGTRDLQNDPADLEPNDGI